MIENPAGMDYDFWKVLKTPKQSGSPRRKSGFFAPDHLSMGRVRLSVRWTARLCSSFHTLPTLIPLKTG